MPDIVKYAGRSAEPLMNYLVSLKDIQIEEHGVYQHPIELLRLAGYDAYYADTLKKQNAISKYYQDGEKLCTFRDENRYRDYHIINAVKHNVDDIKRENFPNPQREDEYGTSVLSIQILKTGGFISIKNRYNHTVRNPDNTLNSNPDNIIKGLSESIKHYYDVDFSSQKVQLPYNFTVMGHQIIHFNYEVNNTYFGENYYAKNGVIYELDKNHEIMLDYFVLDLKTKTIKNPAYTLDCFADVLQKEIEGKKLQIVMNEEGHKCLLADGVQLVELDKEKIVSLNLPNTKEIRDGFLAYNKTLRTLTAPHLTSVGNDFLEYNEVLSSLTVPHLTTVSGNRFLQRNKALSSLTAPYLTTIIGNDFLRYNNTLTSLTISANAVRGNENAILQCHPKRDELFDNILNPMCSLTKTLGEHSQPENKKMCSTNGAFLREK